jgi:hypothetical protein
MKPTQKQIKSEIAALNKIRTQVPAANAFGDSIPDAIDAQIDVLKHDLSEECIDQRSQCDEDEGDDDSLWCEHEMNAAMDARRWMDGDDNVAPSVSWKPLIKK